VRRWRVAGPRPRPSLPGSPATLRWRLTGPCPRLGGRREAEGGREIGGCVWKKTWGKEEDKVRGEGERAELKYKMNGSIGAYICPDRDSNRDKIVPLVPVGVTNWD